MYSINNSESKPILGQACGAPTSLINDCYNLFLYLDYLESVVILCKKAIKYMFLFAMNKLAFTKTTFQIYCGFTGSIQGLIYEREK